MLAYRIIDIWNLIGKMQFAFEGNSCCCFGTKVIDYKVAGAIKIRMYIIISTVVKAIFKIASRLPLRLVHKLDNANQGILTAKKKN